MYLEIYFRINCKRKLTKTIVKVDRTSINYLISSYDIYFPYLLIGSFFNTFARITTNEVNNKSPTTVKNKAIFFIVPYPFLD